MIAGYLGEDEIFDHAVAVFAHRYADLTELDHTAHLAAIDSGRSRYSAEEYALYAKDEIKAKRACVP